jgi:DNA-binding response OmpR family regulator
MSHVFRSGRLLIVDDEPSVRTSLREILEQEGHLVATAASGEEALAALAKEHFDLILVDFKMEGMDGMELMAEAKRITPDAVVVMLTAYGTLDSAIGALRHGAHQRREIVSSIEQGVRQLTDSSLRSEPQAEGPALSRFIRTRDLLLDREKQIVVANGEPLSLTPTEFKLLACLMANMNRTLSFLELAQEALEYECSDREARSALKTHLWRLRKKLRAGTGDDSCITNVRGKGYMFTP